MAEGYTGGGDSGFHGGESSSGNASGGIEHTSQSDTGKVTGGFEIKEANSNQTGEVNPFIISEQSDISSVKSIEDGVNPFVESLSKSPDAIAGKKAETGTDNTDETGSTNKSPVAPIESKYAAIPEKTKPVADKKEIREVIPSPIPIAIEKTEASETEEITREKALKEISLRILTDEELEQTEKSAEKNYMINGHGEQISRAEAVNTMLTDLSSSLESLRESGREISDEQIQAILADAKTALYSQEAESQSRAIGNHGIPHLYSVYERMHEASSEGVLNQVVDNLHEKNPDSKATVDDLRAAMVLAAVYHDEGYLSATARQGAGRDALHGVDSAIAFQYDHAEKLTGAIDPTVLDQVRQAIVEHNGLPSTAEKAFEKVGEDLESNPARAQVLASIDLERNANLDPNDNFIRSALLLSDRLALDPAEKMPDVLRDQERAQVMIEYYQKRTEGTTNADDEAIRQTLREMVQADSSLEAAQKQHYLDAIDKDITTNAGKFDLPMAGVTTPADSLQYKVVRGCDGTSHIEATVDIRHRVGDWKYTLAFDEHSEEVSEMKKGLMKSEDKPSDSKEETNSSIEAAQITKSLKDYGITDTSMKELHNSGTTSDWLVESKPGTFVVQTSIEEGKTGIHKEIDGLKNVTIQISEMTAEDEKREELYMEKALAATSKKAEDIIKEADKSIEDVEANKETIRSIEAQNKTYLEAVEIYQSVYNRNEAGIQDMVTLCTQIYSEENKQQIDRIMGEIVADPDMGEDRIAELAKECAELRAPTSIRKETDQTEKRDSEEESGE